MAHSTASRRIKSPHKPSGPTKAELEAALAKTVPDLIAPDLTILFCGINPGRYSAATGHHFAGPGNQFWPTLFAAGFTPRLLTHNDSHELLDLGYGVTNLVPRCTATADELTRDELRLGARALRAKVRRLRPTFLAIVGFGAYRIAFEQPKAEAGRQDLRIGETKTWLLPNPSGLNAHHQPATLKVLFAELKAAVA